MKATVVTLREVFQLGDKIIPENVGYLICLFLFLSWEVPEFKLVL